MTTAKRQTLADFLYYSLCAGPDARWARSATRRCRSTWCRPASSRSPSSRRPTRASTSPSATCRPATTRRSSPGSPNRELPGRDRADARRPATRPGRARAPAPPPVRQHRQRQRRLERRRGPAAAGGGGTGSGRYGRRTAAAADPADAEASGGPATTPSTPATGQPVTSDGGDARRAAATAIADRSTWPVYAAAGGPTGVLAAARCAPAAARRSVVPPWLHVRIVARAGRDAA